MTGRVTAVLLVDVAIWALIVWYLLASDPGRRAATWYHTARVCQAVALFCGQCAIEAERRYWEEVKP